MEHTFGLRLLDRSRSGVEPTAYGRALVTRGQAIFDELKLGIEELAFLADPTVGELHIASTESVAAGLLPAVLERFSREQPGIRVDVAQAVMNTAHYRDLRERNIDLLIGRIPDPFDESDLEAKIAYDDQVVVVAGRQSKWARSRKLALSDLVKERWVLPPDDTMPGLLGRRTVSCWRRRSASRAHHDAFNASVLPTGCIFEIRDDAPWLYSSLQ